ncbi:hypothetical protein PsorP6_018133 [Peronosclerospora sorghi]|uniref:Uncharacterized protein n=1 Tax=Peronosclerospora sorghi TaxID=230839 RepID=A0ACC0WFH6_9STRA|nr:hypothetical protein PsorP6_018133 [Peronosclerospora sorghi]
MFVTLKYVRTLSAGSCASWRLHGRRLCTNQHFKKQASASVRPRTKEMVVRELQEGSKLMFGGVAIVSALLASGGFVIETVKSLNPLKPPGVMLQLRKPDGELMDVHVQRRGSGDVTVVLDGGVGETSFDWDKVATEVATFAVVLSVDRPGLGFSQPGALPRTSMQIVREYKQLLEQLNVTGNVVLVGHGFGGYNMRALAKELEMGAGNSLKCRGLVLVDALQENVRSELESVSDAVRKLLTDMDRNGEMVLRLSRIGFLRLINVVQHSKLVAKYSAAALPYVEYFSPSPAHREGVLRENQAIPETEQHFRDSMSCVTPFEFPCVVLSHGKADLFDSMKMQAGVTQHVVEELEHKWQDAQTKLANTISTRSVHRVITEAGHDIHHERPEEVAKAVRAIVDEIHGGVGGN